MRNDKNSNEIFRAYSQAEINNNKALAKVKAIIIPCPGALIAPGQRPQGELRVTEENFDEREKASSVETVPVRAPGAEPRSDVSGYAETSCSKGIADDPSRDFCDGTARDAESIRSDCGSGYADILSGYGYRERLNTALKIAKKFTELSVNSAGIPHLLRALKENFAELGKLNVDRILSLSAEFKEATATQIDNVIFAGIFFYVLSAGGYPDERWAVAISDDRSLKRNEVRRCSQALSAAFDKCKRQDFSDGNEASLKAFNEDVKRKDIEPYFRDALQVNVGEAKLYEMLWDVFVNKYKNYGVNLWIKKFNEYLPKEFNVRSGCEYSICGGSAEIIAVSYEGKLDKPGHDGCEDCSLAVRYDDDTWLAAAADGVGSCSDSDTGSRLAADKLAEVIRDRLMEGPFLADRKKGVWSAKRPKDSDWAQLAYFFTFELAGKFYEAWHEAVIKDKNYVNGEEERYTCTLQFAFGCKAFTVCGRVGDGLFFVGKREVVGGRECKGGMLFDDCISGVTQREVLSVACLKDNPSALRTAIFLPGEVTDVIMASDGAECALGTTVRKLIGLCEKLRAMAFADRLEALHKRARQGADYNETQNGSGDDSTVVYISLNTTEEKENA